MVQELEPGRPRPKGLQRLLIFDAPRPDGVGALAEAALAIPFRQRMGRGSACCDGHDDGAGVVGHEPGAAQDHVVQVGRDCDRGARSDPQIKAGMKYSGREGVSNARLRGNKKLHANPDLLFDVAR
jgi:hypothetical protein